MSERTDSEPGAPDRLRLASVTGVDVNLRIAGIGGRSFAFVIDWHIRVAAALAWLGVSWWTGLLRGLPEFDTAASAAFVAVAPIFIIYFLYHPVLEVAMRGRTPGKRMAGVRIVTLDGQVASPGALLVRNLLRVVDSLPALYAVGLVSAAVTRHAVRIGDLAAGTLLVYEEPKEHLPELPQGFFESEVPTPAARDEGGAAAPSQAQGSRFGIAHVDLVRELLGRWEQLTPAARGAMAAQLLGTTADAQTDAGFRERLREAIR